MKEVHGIDVTQPPQGQPPEVLFDWVDPQVKERKRGLGFASPVVPGKTEKGRAFAAEAFGKRVTEIVVSLRIVGRDFEGSSKMVNRLIQPPFMQQVIAEIVLGKIIVRCARE